MSACVPQITFAVTRKDKAEEDGFTAFLKAVDTLW